MYVHSNLYGSSNELNPIWQTSVLFAFMFDFWYGFYYVCCFVVKVNDLRKSDKLLSPSANPSLFNIIFITNHSKP